MTQKKYSALLVDDDAEEPPKTQKKKSKSKKKDKDETRRLPRQEDPADSHCASNFCLNSTVGHSTGNLCRCECEGCLKVAAKSVTTYRQYKLDEEFKQRWPDLSDEERNTCCKCKRNLSGLPARWRRGNDAYCRDCFREEIAWGPPNEEPMGKIEKKEEKELTTAEKAFHQEWRAKLKRVRKSLKAEEFLGVIMSFVPKSASQVTRVRVMRQFLNALGTPNTLTGCNRVLKQVDQDVDGWPVVSMPPALVEALAPQRQSPPPPPPPYDPRLAPSGPWSKDATQLSQELIEVRNKLLKEKEELQTKLLESYLDVIKVLEDQALVLAFVEGQLSNGKKSGARAEFTLRTIRSEHELAKKKLEHAENYVDGLLKERTRKSGW